MPAANNAILTPQAVTRECLRILHQKLTFIGSINRQYDDSFAKSGAKIGTDLRIRLPNEYTVREGAQLQIQDTNETSVTLQVATQKGVDLNFSSVDLTLSLDDFSKRIIDPAMSVLAANVEADALTMYQDVYQQVDNIGGAITFRDILRARQILNDSLTPMDEMRYVCMNTTDNVELVDTLRGLFQSSDEISKQYKKGYMGMTGGFKFMENTLLPNHLTGSNAGTGYLVAGAGQTGASISVDTGTGTLSKGDIITIAGVNAVHAETKADTGVPQQFVVTAAHAGGAGAVSISPAIVTTGGRQNVSASPADNAVVTKVGGASARHTVSLAHHKDAFTFATADLVMPKGVDFSAREVMDGISMRIVRQYDVNNDTFPCRLDILYGYKTIRPELACRLAFNN